MILKIVTPFLILAAAFAGFALMKASKKKPEIVEAVPVIPIVDFVVANPQSNQIKISSQGTLEAGERTILTASVSGLVVSTSEGFETGADFLKGDVLVQIDPLPYESSLADAKANLARTRLSYEEEKARKAQAEQDWKVINPNTPPPALASRKFHLQRSKAEWKAAESHVKLAEQNLSYTSVKAPYSGRMIRKAVDVGQVIAAQGTVLGEMYSTSHYEVELPLELSELSLLEIQMDGDTQALGYPVEFFAEVNGKQFNLSGTISRTGSVIDERTRLTMVIAEVSKESIKHDWIKPGLFLKAYIQGPVLQDTYKIPRGVLNPDGTVFLITEENQLTRKEVYVIAADQQNIIVTGLEPNARICTTPILTFAELMQVQPVHSENLPQTEK